MQLMRLFSKGILFDSNESDDEDGDGGVVLVAAVDLEIEENVDVLEENGLTPNYAFRSQPTEFFFWFA